MTSPPRPRHVATLAVATLLAIPLTAGAAGAQSSQEAGDYHGAADASVLEVTAGDATEDVADGFTLLDASIAPTSTAADTTDGLEHDGESGLTAFGTGTNAGLALAEELEAEGLLVEASQTAPPDNDAPTSEELLEVPADPLLTSQVATAEALARDAGEIACPDDGVVSYGTSQVSDIRLFPEGADGEDVAHLADAVDTRSEVSLVSVDGQDTRGVRSEATSSVSRVELFGGQDADALTIDVLHEPRLTAVAGGTPGTASVDYEAPVVQINGEGFEADPGEEQRLTIPPDAEPGEEDLLVDIAFGQLSTEVADDGTAASGQASVLEVTVLSAVDLGTLAEFSIAPMTAEAAAPEGGVDCPASEAPGVTVTKDGPAEVEPGEEFDYTVEVANDRSCTMTDLEVVDELTGPAGTEVVGTDPDADVDGATVTWSDLDDLEPGASHTLTMTIAVPDAGDGVTYTNQVDATADCDGEPAQGGDLIERPTVVADRDDPLSSGLEADDTPDDALARDAGELPATGGGALLAALAAIGLALQLRRRE